MPMLGCEDWLCHSSTSTFFFFLAFFLTRLCSKNDDLRCLLSHYYDCVVTIKAVPDGAGRKRHLMSDFSFVITTL